MKKANVGKLAGILGIADVLSLWIPLALPARLTPHVGFYVLLAFMSAGVLLTVVAALLHSKWWLLAVAGASVTFAIFFVGGLS